MKIFGKEYGFYLTVDAMCTIADACPGHDISRIEEWIGADLQSVTAAMKVMAPAMSRGYCEVMKEVDDSFDGKPITERLVGLMSPAQIKELEKEIAAAYMAGQETQIETESKKKENQPG
jgi:hypothetical protein